MALSCGTASLSQAGWQGVASSISTCACNQAATPSHVSAAFRSLQAVPGAFRRIHLSGTAEPTEVSWLGWDAPAPGGAAGRCLFVTTRAVHSIQGGCALRSCCRPRNQACGLPHPCQGRVNLRILQQHHPRRQPPVEGQAGSQQEVSSGDTPEHAAVLCECLSSLTRHSQAVACCRRL